MLFCEENGNIICDHCGVINEVIFHDTVVPTNNGLVLDGMQVTIGECWNCKISFQKNRRKKYT